jgi:succinoglycan biosynthesis transport protein ExoP
VSIRARGRLNKGPAALSNDACPAHALESGIAELWPEAHDAAGDRMIETPNNQLKSFALKFALGGVLLMAVAAIYFYGSPKQYEAAANLRVWKRGSFHTNDNTTAFGPELLAAECQLIRSADILDEAVTNLSLGELWGRRYNQGKPIKTEQARERLRLISRVQPIGKSSIISVRVSGDEPNEPARIANEIARVYQQYRENQRSQASTERAKALRERWTQQTAKVQAAQAKLDKLYFDITANRATNQTRVLDADAYTKLQSNRIDLESQYVRDQKKLESLQALNKQQLREVLSTLDTDPNSLLNNTILQSLKAQRELAAADRESGPDSPEVKRARLLVAELDKRINQQVESIMAGKETDLVALKASLDNLNNLPRQAGTNQDRGTLKKFAEEDAVYDKARKELEALKAEEEHLQRDLDQASMDAVLPVIIFAEIVDSADPPDKPAVPDPKIAIGAASAGGFAVVAGLFMLLISSRVKKTATSAAP